MRDLLKRRLMLSASFLLTLFSYTIETPESLHEYPYVDYVRSLTQEWPRLELLAELVSPDFRSPYTSGNQVVRRMEKVDVQIVDILLEDSGNMRVVEDTFEFRDGSGNFTEPGARHQHGPQNYICRRSFTRPGRNPGALPVSRPLLL